MKCNWTSRLSISIIVLFCIIMFSGPAFPVQAPTPGGLLYFTSRNDFEITFRHLPLEDFEESSVADTAIQFFPGPLTSASSNAAFSPGDIIEGISIDTTTTSVAPDNLVAVGGNFSTLGNLSKVVAIRDIAENLAVEFTSPGINVVAMDLFLGTASDTATITIYGAGGVLLDTLTKTINTTATFFGIYSLEAITKITVENASQVEMIDNIQFAQIPKQLTIFTNRAEFDAAHPGLPVEDFEESSVPSGVSSGFMAPLNKESNPSAGFTEGEILEDINIYPITNLSSPAGLLMVGDNYAMMNNPSKLICNGPGASDIQVQFFNVVLPATIVMDTYVVGMDLWQYAPAGDPEQEALVTVYDPFGKFIGAEFVVVKAGQENFIGFSSNQVIFTVHIQFLGSPTNPFECIDNITYGNVQPVGLTFYENESVFTYTRSGLPKEDFSESPVPDFPGIQMCNEPIDSTTDEAGCFSPGDILPGISFQTERSVDSNCPTCMYLIGRNTPPNNNTQPILAVGSSDNLEIRFSDKNIRYVGLQSRLNLITIYGPGDVLLGTTMNYPIPTSEFSFRGVHSNQPISRIVLRGLPWVSEVQFGTNFPWPAYLQAIGTGEASNK